jgi:hypothetical protein
MPFHDGKRILPTVAQKLQVANSVRHRCEVERSAGIRFVAHFRTLVGHRVPEAVVICGAPIPARAGKIGAWGCGVVTPVCILGAPTSQSTRKKMRMLRYSDHDERMTALTK